MKKKTSILSLVLAFALVLSLAPQTVFAGAGLATSKDGDEVNVETVSMALYNDTVAGKYKLIDTAKFKKWVDKKADIVIVDTMPAAWYAQRHVAGALNAEVPLTDEEFTQAQKSALLKQVKAACTVKVKKKTKTGTKTVTKVDKTKKIVVYCGYVKCTRSHVAAKFLVSKGYKNVYRQPGGISAWLDAGNAIEGTDAETATDAGTAN
jgi:rhodanese-related sulfurtransferase